MASKKQGTLQQMFSNMSAKPAEAKMEKTLQPVAVTSNKKTVEKTYQKVTQLEHILLRPDTYIGSVEKQTESMWVIDAETSKFVFREITFVPGLYKIFDEILVNAADNKQNDARMDTIKIDIDQENNTVSVYNNGRGIPVVMHKEQKMLVPTMIFGHLLTSSNYSDSDKKVTGGRNGYGAKLCNIFSTKFCVETASKEYKKSFKQTWGNNMSQCSEPKVKDFSGVEFTKVSFSPDLQKFGMECLDSDIVSLMSRRAYDIAASCQGMKVFLNGTRVPVKNFKEYVELFMEGKEDDTGNPLKVVYEKCSDRWEVAVAVSDKGFQHMSFVNSIATTKGGRHLDYITTMVTNNLSTALAKKNKSGVEIKPYQIKNHLWIFVNALIENPTFDSQTKENMTLIAKKFGSKCTLSDKFNSAVVKSGIIETILTWAKFKQQTMLEKKSGTKTTKLKGIAKLEDANDAGGRFSSECTLILTEGDSAKTLAVAGLGVVGRDRYGVFPLRGKLLNTREANQKQIMENVEITAIIKILGLQFKRKYDSQEDVKSLRYGKLMIMTDQDQDGSHIKGLLINFLHHHWPSLLRQKFLEEFITPIVKATKGKEELSFYSLPEFEEWKTATENWPKYKIKYYKGLGTSTSKEAKEYFSNMTRHRILFYYNGPQDDHNINMAFSKKEVEQRKEWLTTWMLECKRRRELGLPEVYLYEKDTHSINYSDFINKELVLFSNSDNERSIPSLVDGFKPGARKVVFTCLKRNLKHEVKVAQLAGSIAEHTAYHHGETSLMGTIVTLAQNHVGSNNINILQPIGQFGTRLMGGKDSASPRYIFTQLSPLAKLIFHPHDDPLLKYLKDDNLSIEPEWYIPIIPMVLINGAEGIGTGWSTKIPNYCPRKIIDNLKKMIRNEEPDELIPHFKNFKGVIEQADEYRIVTHGEIARISHNKYEITELPIKTWTQHYKETVMEELLGTEKTPAVLSDYREYNTDVTVKFQVTLLDSAVDKVKEEGPHKVFKLQTTMSTNSMVLFDSNGVLRRFDTVMQILREFYELRSTFYVKRKAFMEGIMEAEANKLSNQARFIKEKCSGELVVENKKKKAMIEELKTKGYDSDPVKAWKRVQDLESAQEEEGTASDSDTEDAIVDEENKDLDYDYLMCMQMWSLTKEKIDELMKKEQDKRHELETLKLKTPNDLWIHDLDQLRTELDKVEAQEIEDEKNSVLKMSKKASGGGGASRRKKSIKEECMPSSAGKRIKPIIDDEMKEKFKRAGNLGAAKVPGGKGKKLKTATVVEVVDEFDDILSDNTGKTLSSRLGTSPAAIAAAAKKKSAPKENKGDGLKQTVINFPKKKTRYDWSSGSDDDDIDEISNDGSFKVEPRDRPVTSRRAATAAAAKFNYSDDESVSSDGDVSLHSNEGVSQDDVQGQLSMLDETGDSSADVKPEPKATTAVTTVAKSKHASSECEVIGISDSDSDFDCKPNMKISSKPVESSPEKNKKRAFDYYSDESSEATVIPAKKKPSPKPKKATAAPKTKRAKVLDSDSDDEMVDVVAKNTNKTVLKRNFSESEDDDMSRESDVEVAPRATTGRSRKPVKYNLEDSDE